MGYLIVYVVLTLDLTDFLTVGSSLISLDPGPLVLFSIECVYF